MPIQLRDGATCYVQVIPEGKKAERLDQTHRVVGFAFEDNDHKADKLTLTVLNLDLENFDDPVFRKGGLLEVAWGYEGNLAPARQCVIQKVTGFRKLTIEAHARSILMNKHHRSRRWSGVKHSQVASELATEWGFDAAHQDIEDTDAVHDTIQQAGNLTDAQFMTHLAKREGFVWYVDHNGFHFHRRRFDQKPKRVLWWYADPGQGDMLEDPEIENDITARPGKVTVKGRDPIKRANISEAGSDSATKHASLAPNVEVIDAPTGTTTTVMRNLASDETHTSSASSSAQAKREADGKFLAAQALTVKMKVPIIGDPQVAAKQVVEIRGIGKRLSGKYYLRQVVHRIDDGGFRQELFAIRNGSSDSGLPKSEGKLNAQKAPDKAGSQGGSGGLQSEEIVAQDGTTRVRWRDQ